MKFLSDAPACAGLAVGDVVIAIRSGRPGSPGQHGPSWHQVNTGRTFTVRRYTKMPKDRQLSSWQDTLEDGDRRALNRSVPFSPSTVHRKATMQVPQMS